LSQTPAAGRGKVAWIDWNEVEMKEQMMLAALSRRALLTVAVVAPVMARGLPAWADEAAEAKAFVDKLAEEALTIIKQPDVSTPERQKRFYEMFSRAFDVPQIGRFVLGRHWQRLKPEEQQQFLDIFGRYVASIYASQFSEYRGYNFRTTGARPTSPGEVSVPAQIDREGQAPIRMDFRLRKEEAGFRIADVAVESVSLILTKRDEFSTTLNTEGVSGVMKRMQAVIDNAQRAS
jgi:phospholipid transport system substrate-binding protein